MFYIIQLTQNIFVEAEELGPLFRRRLEGHLRKKVEGNEVHPHGLVIAVMDILGGNKMTGKVLEDGGVKVVVQYEALVFRLNKDEVVDAVVERVTPEGLYCEVGPATVHVPVREIHESYEYDATSTLVARYVQPDGSKSISPGYVVRIKILAEVTKVDAFRAVASMMDPFLGPRT